MPSIQDVADQINAKLDQINTNTSNTAQNTGETAATAKDIRSELQTTNARLAGIDFTLKLGFSNLGQGLFAISELHKVTNAILNHHSKQNDTIICLLENSNELLCGITRKITKQLELSEATLVSVRRTEGIQERVNGEQAVAYDRNRELTVKVEECCPPPEPQPEPCPDPCKVPDFKPPRPDGQDWKPLPEPKEPQPDPIG